MTIKEVTTIELARADDLERIVALVNRAAETSAANFATEPEPIGKWRSDWSATCETHPWLVARSGDSLVGFAKASPHRERGAYRWTAELSVYIDEAWHGHGIGTALYRVLIPLLRAQGYVTLLAGVTVGHVASERLHERAGLAPCGTFHRAGWKMGAWHDVGYWELQLSPDGEPAPIRPVSETWTARAAGHDAAARPDPADPDEPAAPRAGCNAVSTR